MYVEGSAYILSLDAEKIWKKGQEVTDNTERKFQAKAFPLNP